MIVVDSVTRRYVRGEQTIDALRQVSLRIESGQFVAIMGPSGSGKSTLLNLIGALDQPTSGSITIDGRPIHGMSDDERTRLRREQVAFVFQFFNLLPTMTAIENVCLPALLAGRKRAELWPKGKALLERFGLADRVDHLPKALSGGEMQRVAIARALIVDPKVLLADEPTGNLDSEAGRKILELLRDTSRDLGRTIVMVTHDPRAAEYAERVIEIRDGAVASG